MSPEIDLLDLFAGIGGFSLGLENAGFKIRNHYYSEINAHALAVYKLKFKNATYVGSVESVDKSKLPPPNIITFGSPCQDFSLAGQRKGLKGSKSSLIREGIRLVELFRPDVFIWENVKGVFSSNDSEDFWAVIKAFTDIGGYRFEWQLLNTSWFLPQNRERMYLIGSLAESGRDWKGIFPFGENDFLSQTQHPGESKEPLPCITATEYKGPSKQRAANLIIQKTGGKNISISEINTLQAGEDNVRDKIPNFVSQIRVAKPSRTEEAKKIRAEIRKEGRDHTPYQGKKFEFVETDLMNAISTSLAPDNLLELEIANCVTPDAYLATGKRKRDEKGKAVLTSMCERRIRQLTEIECERLQGFPDNWTEYGDYDGVIKKVSKTQRYKMTGNAVTVAVVENIGKRLLTNY